MDKIVDKRLVILSMVTFCFLISVFLVNSNVSYAAPANIPQIVEITPSTLEQNALNVSWRTNNTGNDYSIEVFNNTTKKIQKFAGSVTHYTFKNLRSDQTYNFMIRACHRYTNCTKWSNVKSSSYTNDDFKVTLSAKTYTYDGKEHKPVVTVKNKEGITLTINQDYTVAYPKDLKSAGNKTITVRGLGKYAFEQKPTYTITSAAKTPAVTLSKLTYIYDGKEHKPVVTVKLSGKKMTNKDYTVTYPSDKKSIGKHNIKVIGKGNYKFTSYKSYRIIPASTKITKTSSTKNSITVNYSSQKGSVRYLIEYKKASASTNSYKSITTNKTSHKITGLSSNTKYNVRVKTYKKVNNISYFANSFSSKTVTTKKVTTKKTTSTRSTSGSNSSNSSNSSGSSSGSNRSSNSKSSSGSKKSVTCKSGYTKYGNSCITWATWCKKVYGSNYVYNGAGCQKKTTTGTTTTHRCSGGKTWSTSKKKCVCPSSRPYQLSGGCYDKAHYNCMKKSGYYWNGSKCVSKCKSGYSYINGHCQKILTCKKKYKLVNGKCKKANCANIFEKIRYCL